MKKTLVVVLLGLALAAPAYADPVLGFALGGNGVWTDESARPGDFEAGMTGRASFSPHLSLVGAGFYGFSGEYVRGSGGVRVTATDTENRNFSVGFGAEYAISSDEELRPEEWKAVTAIGWRPYPNSKPRWILGAQGDYGFKTSEAGGLLALRYVLTPGGQ